MNTKYFKILLLTFFIFFNVVPTFYSASMLFYTERNLTQVESSESKMGTSELPYADLWDLNGTPICLEIEDQDYPQICSDGAGGAIITWEDHRNASNYNIFAQRVDSSGVVNWDVNGKAICMEIRHQFSPQVCSDGAGGAIITWQDDRNGVSATLNYDIYAQRIDSNGNAYWIHDGIPICRADSNQYSPQICSDGVGGAIITWYDLRSGADRDIYAQRVGSNGNIKWTPNGTVICTENDHQESPQICTDGAGGAIITWMDYRNGADRDIFAHRIDSNGNIKWVVPNGTAICTEIDHQWRPQICYDGAGGAIITWYDYRNGAYSDIYAQKINSTGSVKWTVDGKAICTATHHQSFPDLCSDGAGGAIITWEDRRNFQAEIYAQGVDFTGTMKWIDDGEAVCTGDQGMHSPKICSDGAGGGIIIWEDWRNAPFQDVFTQGINATGDVQWTIEGIALCTEIDEQSMPQICSDGLGGAIFVWRDKRSESNFDIYASAIEFTSPNIIINSPNRTNNIFGKTPPNFNINIDEWHLDATWYTLDGGLTNVTFTGLSGAIDPIEWNKYGNGTVTIKFYANDTIGLEDSAYITVQKDIISPEITINAPLTNQEFENTPPAYEISIIEPNIDKMWYTLDGGATNISITSLTGSINQSIWKEVPKGIVTIRFYVIDKGLNIGFKDVTIIKKKSNFWDDLLRQGLLIPLAAGIVTGVVGLIFYRIKKRKK